MRSVAISKATITLILVAITHAASCSQVVAQVPDPSKLEMEEWASNGMTQDPVALSFDNQGRLFVAETARRSTVDIDMRAHRSWLLHDLESDSFEKMRDFFRSEMSASLSEKNKGWLMDRNEDGIHDYRDLREVKERIRLIEDTNGDGKADKSTVYAQGFNEEFNGVMAGVMPYGDDVLMTVYPDLWRLTDTDGDRKADKKEIMFRGFGVHAALDGHDLHGLTVGPEGKIYFSCGDNGFSIKTKEGKQLHHPNTGGVLRMNPDGTDLEVFAIGLRNVQEFDFDQYGNMFAVDNDGDLEDERERAVYIAEGSDSGWRLTWQFISEGWKEHNGGLTYNPWVTEDMWKPAHSQQPAHITPPMQNYSVGPGGFKFNPGTALNDEYRNFFFCIQFPVKKVTAFRTRPAGAGFEMIDEHTFNGGLMVSSVNFGPDGGCYLADWVGKWSPNGEGIIYRVDDPTVRGSQLRKQVQQYLNDGVTSETNDQLLKLLGHADRRVRQLAQFELVERGRGPELLSHANDVTAEQLGRIHALWGLIQLEGAELAETFASELPWADADYQIRQQCCRVAGDLKLKVAEQHLIESLEDSVPLVRSHAAIALGKAGSTKATGSLVELLRANADLDPFLRHGAVMGLAGAASASQLVALKSDESEAVRVGAVLALRRKRSWNIRSFVADQDVRVLRETVRAIHDDLSIEGALPEVAKLLDRSDLPSDEPTLRRIVSANYRIGDNASAKRLLDFIVSDRTFVKLTETLKLEALECLAKWSAHPSVDRVEGRIRTKQKPNPDAGHEQLRANIDRLLATGNGNVSAVVLRYVNDLNIQVKTKRFRSWVTDPRLTPNARIESLRLLREQRDPGVKGLVEKLVTEKPGGPVWEYAFRLLAEDRPEKALAAMDWSAPLSVRQFYLALLPKFANQRADQMLRDAIDSQLQAKTPAEVQAKTALDVVSAAKQRKETVKQFAMLKEAVNGLPYGEFSLAIEGGNAARGEHLYRTHANAQCIRCHSAGGMGKQAGPVLDEVGKQNREYLLRALVDPSDTIAKGFESVTIIKDNGKTITGTIVTENDEVLMLGAPNKTYKIRKAEIEERIEAKQSAMPKMTEVLTPLEVRDLVEYLTTLKSS